MTSVMAPLQEAIASACVTEEHPGNLEECAPSRVRPISGCESGGEDLWQMVELLRAENEALRQKVDELSKYRRYAFKDDLTGLYNRRHFNEHLTEEWNRAIRYHAPMSLIYIDLNDFKSVNDIHGHLIGDSLLIWIAQFLRCSCRLVDIPCRIGGDEFAIIMPSTSRDDATKVLDRLRRKLRYATRPRELSNLAIRFSSGLACTTDVVSSAKELLGLADQEMYRDKQREKRRGQVAA